VGGSPAVCLLLLFLLSPALFLRRAIEFGIEAEVSEIGHPHGVENAVQVVIFMLHDPGVEPGCLAFDHVAVAVDAAIADPQRARHHGAHLGDREATFPVQPDLIADRLDLRVDQDGVGHRAGGGIGRGSFGGNAKHEQTERHVNLRTGQADARRILHRLHHVGDEPAAFRRAWVGHRLTLLQQDRVAHAGDFQDGHAGSPDAVLAGR